MITQSVTIDVGGNAMPAYLARPDDGKPRPAVIVLQEIFGVNTEIKRITELVAAAGYVALAINYYHRTHPELNEPYTPDGMKSGFAAAGGVTRAGLRADITAAMEWLNAQATVQSGHVGTWGFCFGGTASYFAATIDGIACAVSFYGGHIASPLPSGEAPMIEETKAIKAPLFLAFGGADASIPIESIEKIKTALEAAHKDFQLQIYPGQPHAFFRESTKAMPGAGGDEARSEAVSDAWKLTQAFFKKHLD